MQGSPWSGTSGVPGLGYSVPNHVNNTKSMKSWDESMKEGNEKATLSDKISKLFSFSRRKNDQLTNSSVSDAFFSVALPKVSVRRSVSSVAVSHRAKVITNSGDEKCQSLQKTNKNISIKRSVSLFKEFGSTEKQKEKKCFSESYLKAGIIQTCPGRVPILPLQLISEGKASENNTLQRRVGRCNESGLLKSQATQTEAEIIEEVKDEDDYDYAYSNFMSPAMLIRLVEELEQREKEEVVNIYEEIIPKERKIGRSKSLLSPMSQSRREHRLTEFEMEQEMNKANKDNYIHPQAVKKQLETEISENLCNKRKSREVKSVTFNVDDIKLTRSKSVNPTS